MVGLLNTAQLKLLLKQKSLEEVPQIFNKLPVEVKYKIDGIKSAVLANFIQSIDGSVARMIVGEIQKLEPNKDIVEVITIHDAFRYHPNYDYLFLKAVNNIYTKFNSTNLIKSLVLDQIEPYARKKYILAPSVGKKKVEIFLKKTKENRESLLQNKPLNLNNLNSAYLYPFEK